MIIFDFETTGLLKADINDLSKQPKAIEFAGIKLDDKTLEEKDRLEFLVNPKEKLDPKITKITGLTDLDLISKPDFKNFYPQLVKFFIGEKYLFAHNIVFDVKILKYELQRLRKSTAFPFPPIQVCTVNQTYKIKNRRMSLGELYTHLFGDIMPKGHRAMVDVEVLSKIVKELIKQEIVKI